MNWRWTGKVGAWALGVALIFAGGMGAGWMLWKPKAPKVENYARSETQKDGSLILERKPQADAKPAQEVPKGATVERIVRVVVQPDAHASSQPGEAQSAISGSAPGEGAAPAAAMLCPPVQVDLTLIRLLDGTRRVTASSPDGRVLQGSVDIPVEAAPPAPRVLKWAAGAVYGGTAWGDKAIGAFVDRDFAFLRTGLEVTKNTYAEASRQGWEIRGRLGIRF